MENRIAVVTGAGTGLGFATAKLLKENGWKVYGTIIEGQDNNQLENLGIITYIVNIADPIQVKDFANFVEQKKKMELAI